MSDNQADNYGQDNNKSISEQPPWATPWEEIARNLEVSSDNGLSAGQVRERRRKFGKNRLQIKVAKSWISILVAQLKNLIVGLLAVASALSFVFDQWLEGVSILVAIGTNILIGFFTELKAVRSMEALRTLSRVTTKVRREGKVQEIHSEELVPGDIVVFEGGDVVSADIRLLEAAKLEVDESTLTGESVPVNKKEAPLEADVPLAERNNMLFKGTSITRGSGQGIVVTIGMETELGKISALAEQATDEVTPLEKRLDRLGQRLIMVTLAIAGVVLILGFVSHDDIFLIVETAVALVVAAVPEGLPVVATIALARGVWRMARRNALVNRLSSIEALGSVNTVCADKTGTLTENRMSVRTIVIPSSDGEDLREIEVSETDEAKERFSEAGDIVTMGDDPLLSVALETAVLCNNAHIDKEGEAENRNEIGDPLEIALLNVGRKAQIDRDKLLERFPEIREDAFDPSLKMMATYHKAEKGFRIAVKGAPEAILETCSKTFDGNSGMTTETREKWLERNKTMAEKGLRVIAMASKESDTDDVAPYSDLAFVGLFGLEDPPREGIAASIESFRNAGIRVVMVTGDQPQTAKSIASSLGIIDADESSVIHGSELKRPDDASEQERSKLAHALVFARVSPEQKLDLVDMFQKEGAIVGMTGDGVNDAPALKKANVGIAMGKRGTQVAREAADVILKDDSFDTIVVAVEQGRAIFDNIRRFVLFLLSGNVAEIMIVSFALVAGAPLPILPLQILYLNMIGDVFPALALGLGRSDPGVMRRPPRDPGEPILTERHWAEICGYGLVLAATVLAAFFMALAWFNMPLDKAVTISFLTVSFARLWHTFNMKDWGASLFSNSVIVNPWVWGSLALCSLLLLAAVYEPHLSAALSLVSPDQTGWALIGTMSIWPLIAVQVIKSSWVSRRLNVEAV